MLIRSILGSICGLSLVAAIGVSSAGSLNNADKQFMIQAAKTDMTEAHEGQMAQDKADRADVKDFGKTLVHDHTESYGRLTEMAAKMGVSIPKGINSAQDPTIKQLTHLKGAGFDRQFSKEEVAAHRRALAVFKREAAHGKDADLKAYAEQRIPILEKHLHLAEECAKPLKHG